MLKADLLISLGWFVVNPAKALVLVPPKNLLLVSSIMFIQAYSY